MVHIPEWVGIDVGGTFTDFVWLRDGVVHVHKVSTTSADQSQAILTGLEALGVSTNAPVLHGTTVATNALLERRGARTALLTTQGFRDILVIGRQNRPHLYRLSQTRPPVLVPDTWRFEIPERLDAKGNVLTPLDLDAVRPLISVLQAEHIESIAVVFLFSFENPSHEAEVARLLTEHLPDVPISLSSVILPEYREYERTATTVINAYVRPLVSRYLDRLSQALGDRPIQVMQSNGGMSNLNHASEQAARLVVSGPAGGVVGAFVTAQHALQTDTPDILTFDMGGTSTDVALCPGRIPYTAESTIAALPLRVPTTDIHTVGAGGGSIASVDSGGILRVGPQSAGADPGPACYNRGGTQPTVTDANLVLGRLRPVSFLGGSTTDVTLDVEAARTAIHPLAEALQLSVEATALGIVRVANAAMERALRRVSVERGHDPRKYVLVPFGGAGPLQACDLAASLGISRILVAPYPGVLSALGLLFADTIYDTAHALLQPLTALYGALPTLKKRMAESCEHLKTHSPHAQAYHFEAALDMRYKGQSYELSVPLALPLTRTTLKASEAAFHALHKQRYGHAHPDAALEAVTLRVRSIQSRQRPSFPSDPPTTSPPAATTTQSVWFTAEGPQETPCYDRASLQHGHYLHGPAILYQYDTTTLVPPGWDARVDAWRNVWLEHR